MGPVTISSHDDTKACFLSPSCTQNSSAHCPLPVFTPPLPIQLTVPHPPPPTLLEPVLCGFSGEPERRSPAAGQHNRHSCIADPATELQKDNRSVPAGPQSKGTVQMLEFRWKA